jgi:hypothetical protein
MAPVSLTASQSAHAQRLIDILQQGNDNWAIDLSMMGAGKTYTTTEIAEALDFDRVIVVAPKAVVPKWRHMQAEHGLRISDVWTWQKMCGTKNAKGEYKIGHPYLKYDGGGNSGSLGVAAFAPTREYTRLIAEERVLLVMDEVQNIKNARTNQTYAARQLITAITRAGSATRSKVLLLSGSPVDKYEHIATLMRNLGVITVPHLAVHNPMSNTTIWTGAQEMHVYAGRFSPITARMLRDCNANDTKRYIGQAFVQVVKQHKCSAMPPSSNTFQIAKRTALYEVRDEDAATKISDIIADLESAACFNTRDSTVNMAGGAQGDGLKRIALINKLLLQLEDAKTDLFVDAAVAALERDPNVHVAICLSYRSSLAAIAQKLSRYGPLLMQGCTSEADRKRAIELFNAPGTTHRLLIGNIRVMSVGIDLDDKHGAFPRMALVSPNYDTINQYQLGHRFLRMNTASDSVLHFVFAKHRQEAKLLAALARKGEVMKEVGKEQADAGVVFPGAYQTITVV